MTQPAPGRLGALARIPMSLVAVLAAGVLFAAVLSWTAYHSPQPGGQERSSAQEYQAPPPGMVLVPAGEFLMGSNDPAADPDERPLRKVFLPAYYIDQFEVTNRRYQEVRKDHRFPAGEEDLPVTFILKREAEEYCRLIGKRLPTNAEWEKAARGTDGRAYPWGDEFKTGYCNVLESGSLSRSNGLLCKLPASASSHGKVRGGTFPKGASPYGCQDMSGNVWEWVGDEWRDAGLPGQDQTGERRGILRGGAYHYSRRQARTSHQAFEALEATCHDVGFRCAMAAVPKQAP